VAYVMANGHSETDIRFAHPDAASAYGDITDVPSRQIFSRAGGGATYRAPPSDIQTTPTDWIFVGRNVVHQVGSVAHCGTDNCTDLIALLMNVSKSFCLLMNDKSNVINTAGEPPKEYAGFNYTDLFTGSFEYSKTMLNGAGAAELHGKLEGCFEGDTDPPAGTYHYYRVLLAR